MLNKQIAYSLIFVLFNLSYANEVVILPVGSKYVFEFIKKYLPNNPVILEAGAFNGKDTIELFKLFSRKARIHAFEPEPRAFKLLIERTKKFKKIKTYNLALSNYNGYMNFYPSNVEGKVSGSSSLLVPHEHLIINPHIKFDNVIKVKTMKLDDWALKNKISKVDFMWLDMQGFELPMLQSGLKLLKTVKLIYTEVELVELYKNQPLYKDVKNWLEQQGFKLIAKDFTDEVKGSGYGFGNAIFLRQ